MNQSQTIDVSWNRYAKKYDMLMAYNPFYQKLNQEVLNRTKVWNIPEGGKILDLAGGTGNYSTKLAAQFPNAQVIHIDNDQGMCSVVSEKKGLQQLHNLQVVNQDVDEVIFDSNFLQGAICIHALYTFPNPQEILSKMYDWLKPGGYGLFVNPGRLVNVLDWQIAIGWQMVMKHGIQKTLQIMQEGKEVSYQNKQISKLQRNGTYWTHSHEEFKKAVKDAGFQIVESRLCFRKISDMVAVRK